MVRTFFVYLLIWQQLFWSLGCKVNEPNKRPKAIRANQELSPSYLREQLTAQLNGQKSLRMALPGFVDPDLIPDYIAAKLSVMDFARQLEAHFKTLSEDEFISEYFDAKSLAPLETSQFLLDTTKRNTTGRRPSSQINNNESQSSNVDPAPQQTTDDPLNNSNGHESITSDPLDSLCLAGGACGLTGRSLLRSTFNAIAGRSTVMVTRQTQVMMRPMIAAGSLTRASLPPLTISGHAISPKTAVNVATSMSTALARAAAASPQALVPQQQLATGFSDLAKSLEDAAKANQIITATSEGATQPANTEVQQSESQSADANPQQAPPHIQATIEQTFRSLPKELSQRMSQLLLSPGQSVEDPLTHEALEKLDRVIIEDSPELLTSSTHILSLKAARALLDIKDGAYDGVKSIYDKPLEALLKGTFGTMVGPLAGALLADFGVASVSATAAVTGDVVLQIMTDRLVSRFSKKGMDKILATETANHLAQSLVKVARGSNGLSNYLAVQEVMSSVFATKGIKSETVHKVLVSKLIQIHREPTLNQQEKREIMTSMILDSNAFNFMVADAVVAKLDQAFQSSDPIKELVDQLTPFLKSAKKPIEQIAQLRDALKLMTPSDYKSILTLAILASKADQSQSKVFNTSRILTMFALITTMGLVVKESVKRVVESLDASEAQLKKIQDEKKRELEGLDPSKNVDAPNPNPPETNPPATNKRPRVAIGTGAYTVDQEHLDSLKDELRNVFISPSTTPPEFNEHVGRATVAMVEYASGAVRQFFRVYALGMGAFLDRFSEELSVELSQGAVTSFDGSSPQVGLALQDDDNLNLSAREEYMGQTMVQNLVANTLPLHLPKDTRSIADLDSDQLDYLHNLWQHAGGIWLVYQASDGTVTIDKITGPACELKVFRRDPILACIKMRQ